MYATLFKCSESYLFWNEISSELKYKIFAVRLRLNDLMRINRKCIFYTDNGHSTHTHRTKTKITRVIFLCILMETLIDERGNNWTFLKLVNVKWVIRLLWSTLTTITIKLIYRKFVAVYGIASFALMFFVYNFNVSQLLSINQLQLTLPRWPLEITWWRLCRPRRTLISWHTNTLVSIKKNFLCNSFPPVTKWCNFDWRSVLSQGINVLI